MQGALQTFVAKDTKYAAKNGTASSATRPYELDEGAVGVYKKDSTGQLTLINSGDTVGDAFQIFIAQGLGTDSNGDTIQPRISKPIAGDLVKRWMGTGYQSGTGKQVAIGYDGSSGSITVNGNEYYTLAVEEHWTGSKSKDDREHFDYTTSNGASGSSGQYEIAHNISKKINGDVGSRPRKTRSDIVYAEVISDNSVSDVAYTIDVTNGSKQITTGANMTGDFSEGDYISLNNVIYTIDTIDTNTTATLDRTFVGSTATYSANSSASGNGTVSGANNFGIRLSPRKNKYYYRVGTGGGAMHNHGGFDDTPVSTITDYVMEINSGDEVERKELLTLGYEGKTDYIRRYRLGGQATADTSIGYDTYIIEFVNAFQSNSTIGYEGINAPIIIAVPNSSYTGRSTLEQRLNTWMGSTTRSFSAVNL